MQNDDRDKWDSIYRGRALESAPSAPAELLSRFADALPSAGRALDVAGGSGRNAVWLAARGMAVTVADISPVGLELAVAVALAAGVEIETLEIDLEESDPPAGPWQLIVDFHFLSRPLLRGVGDLLAPGGLFVFCQPTLTNLERHAKPSGRFLLDPGELPTLLPDDLEVIHYREDWSPEGRHEAELVARLPHVA